ncbi:unnamed protein product [Citrullus colocynthis]|uniref:Uncharacterized protein n=1 Tax=Citrullus colocynthis TaxID=252529 RepID=A0ABP0XZB0_9ROSI
MLKKSKSKFLLSKRRHLSECVSLSHVSKDRRRPTIADKQSLNSGDLVVFTLFMLEGTKREEQIIILRILT